jgi:hypothetical protein
MKHLSKYYIEIDCDGIEASGYEDTLPWCSYGTIVAEGDTLEQLFETATVDLVDQDGGECGQVEADKTWMQDLVYEEYLRQISLSYKLKQIYKRVAKPFKRQSHFDAYKGKKPNLWQKLLKYF